MGHPSVALRKIAAQNLKKQAERMVLRGKGLLPAANVGDNVLLSIPSVDRGRGDPANLIAVILQKKDEKYQVATKDGILNRFITFVLQNNFEQYYRCSCKQKCQTNRCAYAYAQE